MTTSPASHPFTGDNSATAISACPSRSMTARRVLARLAVVALVGTMTIVDTPSDSIPTAAATGSISLDEPFTGATLNDPSKWISMAGGTITEWPCLTAATVSASASIGTVEACVNQNGPAPVADGSGAMRLTRRRAVGIDQNVTAGSLLYTDALSAAEGIDISFSIKMDAGTVADGMSFFLKDGSNVINDIGTGGGALGYGMGANATRGVPGALLGVGFDRFGNFSSRSVASASPTCAQSGTFTGAEPSVDPSSKNALVLRGPDLSAQQDGSAGYCYLTRMNVNYVDGDFQKIRIVVPPYTPGTATTVSVYVAPGTTPDVVPSMPTLTQSVTLSATSFKFGFSAASGWWSNNHDLRGLLIRPAGPVLTAVASSAPTGSGTGPTSGGTLLTINGTDISANATVTVDGQPCTGVTVSASSTQLTCTTPPGSPGTKQVVVTNPNGGPGYGTFTYQNPTPTVTAVSPSSGLPAGGDTITITGTGFVANATATVGGQPCTGVVVQSSTSLTCVVAAGTDGTVVDATVTNLGPVSGTGVGLYTYTSVVATPTPAPPPPAATMPTTVPDTTTPATDPEAAPADPPVVAAGSAIATEDDAVVPVESFIEAARTAVVRNDDFEVRLTGQCTTGCTVTADSTGRETVVLHREGVAQVTGLGFQAGTEVQVRIGADQRLLGSLAVDEAGAFDGSVLLTGIDTGEVTLRATGVSRDGKVRTVSIDVVVRDLVAPDLGAAELPRTGSSTTNLLLFVSLLLAAAGSVLVARRRTTPAGR